MRPTDRPTDRHLQPLAIDLCCGLGGWTEGLLMEGYRVVGFDNERHVYGEHAYPEQLVLQDVLTIHGAQLKTADLIVASPPCQEFSYMAMPWSLAKQKAKEYRDGTRDVKQLTALFDACFRIQREASEAKGEYIPLVVENVCGAQKWVGRARWHFGSFYLWGDVPALMPTVKQRAKVGDVGKGARSTSRDCGVEGKKGVGIGSVSWGQGKDQRHQNDPRNTWSNSPARKHASAMIAKIPLVLSRHIAASWRPHA